MIVSESHRHIPYGIYLYAFTFLWYTVVIDFVLFILTLLRSLLCCTLNVHDLEGERVLPLALTAAF